MNDSFVTKISIKSIRNIKDTVIELSDKEAKNLILTGPNGSGKTSLLEALWLNITNRLQQDSRVSQISGLDVYFSNIDKMREAYIQGNFIVSYYRDKRNYEVASETGARKVDLKDAYTVSESPGEDFVEYLKTLIIQETMYRKQQENAVLADGLRQRVERVRTMLRNVYDNDDIDFDFDIANMNLRIKEPEREPYGFNELASGYAAILSVVLDLMMWMEKKVTDAYDLPGIVMIDEVEAHLHLAKQRNVFKNLTDLFPNIQFIVTTNSPFVLNSVENVVIYDLGSKLRVGSEAGLSKLPYSGIVEGYFGASELSAKLKAQLERYKELARKNDLTDDDYEELGMLESTLNNIPDFLALGIMADFRQIQAELQAREEGKV
ncbi:AAA family ATPase [Selenomonas ruminantium]|uniref:AAA domain-containing protein, putative AbiEii toxin, Type IV TA system n=1 Tax=Selenomonas ruminantium TaxID=971 RepID=A0A1I0Y3G4_SELRU|nr:AAA family ATPase [Selenomonas ruminantium]SFB07226.1 AAA domain-containing protein, putative AbiEii toxin, Type IV TA system [Selenomonas ruminantium]